MTHFKLKINNDFLLDYDTKFNSFEASHKMMLYRNLPNLIIFAPSVKCLLFPNFAFTIITTIMLLKTSKLQFHLKCFTIKKYNLSYPFYSVLKYLWIFPPNLLLQNELKLCTFLFLTYLLFYKMNNSK